MGDKNGGKKKKKGQEIVGGVRSGLLSFVVKMAKGNKWGGSHAWETREGREKEG